MKTSYLVFTIVLVFTIGKISGQEIEDITIGKKITIYSDVLNQDREIYIHLPDGYNDCVSSYPVIYVLDAEQNFHPMSGLIKLMSWQKLIPKMIVVGIPNINRIKDFMPAIDTIPTSGGADKFVSFFSAELFPHIQKNYRTESFKILYGYSYSGMFAVHCFKKYPEIFNAYIAGSPSLKWNIDYLCSDKTPSKKLDRNSFLHISIGELENTNSIDKINRFTSYLETQDAEKLIWKSDLVNNANHDINAAFSLSYGLNFIFSDWKKIKQVIYQGMTSVENHYSKLSDKYNYTVKVPEDIYQKGGIYYLQNGNVDKSIEIFMKYIQSYKSSYTAYNYLGKALILKKDIKKAEENFQKALELKPDYKDAIDNLETIYQERNKN